MKRYGHIDLEGNELQNSLLENLASAPSTATGRVYFNSSDAVAQVYDGSGWVDLHSPDDDFHNNLSTEAATADTDELLIWDASAAGYRRQTKSVFLSTIPDPTEPHGSNRNIQYNASGSFGSDDDLQWSTSNALHVNRSHTAAYSDTGIDNPAAYIFNNNDDAVAAKYASLEFQVDQDGLYLATANISCVAWETTSYRSRLYFQVREAAGTYVSPFMIDPTQLSVTKPIGMGLWTGTGIIMSSSTSHDFIQMTASGATSSNYFLQCVDSGTVFEIDGDGRVGIGRAASSTYDLDVDGDAYLRAQLAVGTQAPVGSYPLTVSGNITGDATIDNAGILIENQAANSECGIALQTGNTGSNYWFVGINQDEHLALAYGTSLTDVNTIMEINSANSNVCIGGVNPSSLYKLQVLGDFNADNMRLDGRFGVNDNWNNGWQGRIYNNTSGQGCLWLDQDSTTGHGLRIDVTGSTAAQYIIQVNNGAAGSVALTADGDWLAANYHLNSDPRMKDVYGPPEDALSIISALEPVSFRWKDHRDDHIHIGFLSDNIKCVRPELVKEAPGEYDSVSYSKITAINTAAIKELYQLLQEIKELLNEKVR